MEDTKHNKYKLLIINNLNIIVFIVFLVVLLSDCCLSCLSCLYNMGHYSEATLWVFIDDLNAVALFDVFGTM